MKSFAEESMKMNALARFLVAALLIGFTITAKAAEQKSFATPEKAVQALVKATEDGNQDEMLAIFGAEGKELVYSGDAVQDKASRDAFLRAYKKKHSIVAEDKSTRILQVGPNDWPMPIPLVKDGSEWRFDTAAGKEELLYRRIGRNELGAIAVCRGFIDAEKDYAATGHDGLPSGLYAQKLQSNEGEQNGLYWETKEGEPKSPAGPFLAQAGGQGYVGEALGKAQPYHGYLYRVLKAQGPAANGGEKNYVDNDGNLSGGVALVAYPAEYKVSGVMTFIVNLDGVVYQKDLGEKTAEIAGAMTAYNPDSTWKRVAP